MPSPREKSTLPVLFSIIVIDLIGFGIVLPVLPFYADEYGASGLVLGVLFTSHAAMQALFAPVWGRLADRVGRRPVMLFTIAGTAFAMTVLGTAESLFQLFVGRILSGTFAANISVATAYITDVTEEHERTKWMARVGASFAIGFTVGPIIGGLLAPYGYGVPMLTAAGFAAVNFVYAAAVLKEPESHEAGEKERGIRLKALADPVIRNLCITYFLYSLAVAQLETIFAYFMKDSFGYDALGVAGVLVLMAVVMGGIQGGGTRRLVERYGERSLLLAGVLIMAVAFLAVPWPGTVPLLMIPLLGAAVGRAISQPSMMGLVSFEGTASNKGAVMGAFQSSASAARVLGPLAAGALYDFAHAAPFYLASALSVAAFAVSSRLPKPASNQRR